jgi:hypothetical protein
MAGSCKREDELLGFIESGKFLDYLTDYDVDCGLLGMMPCCLQVLTNVSEGRMTFIYPEDGGDTFSNS